METQDTLVSDFLAHYGVKGMRWGVRKERDRSPVKVETRVRNGKQVQTFGGKNQKTSPDAVRVAVIKQKANKNSFDQLSNKELQTAIQRMQLERQFAQLAGERKSVGRKVAAAILSQIGDKEAAALGAAAATATASPHVGFAVGMTARAIGTKPQGKKKK